MNLGLHSVLSVKSGLLGWWEEKNHTNNSNDRQFCLFKGMSQSSLKLIFLSCVKKKKLTLTGEEGRQEGKPTKSVSKACDVVDTAFTDMSNSTKVRGQVFATQQLTRVHQVSYDDQ